MASLIRQTVAEMLALPSPVLADRSELRVTLTDPVCQVLLSGPASAPAFRSAASTALGFDLSAEPNRLTGNAAHAFWMAPQQWLIVSDDRADHDLALRLERAVGPVDGFVSEITDGFARFGSLRSRCAKSHGHGLRARFQFSRHGSGPMRADSLCRSPRPPLSVGDPRSLSNPCRAPIRLALVGVAGGGGVWGYVRHCPAAHALERLLQSRRRSHDGDGSVWGKGRAQG